ncbi:redox-sensing transcriptional repressor Rex [Desulfurispira natronophila]|uniref:Redox-sensing transcriptional repressor Rex n=1 Tax=Desulfurispira natronophila TaxID=682562 RepID=A0A7W8DFW3_9BACT|nr:redox-sensing transcriptional repressor Rex [Desulfurispira natronophila]MBB5020759.1 redox-sensing transcriptional repressor [Desulfurispira natronophila]
MKIPEATIRRLSTYIRVLATLEKKSIEVVSSGELSNLCGFNSAQIRKDLAYFGEMGVRGVGYYVSDLKREIEHILGLDRKWNVVLFGVGNLGHALISYNGFRRSGFYIRTAYDIDPNKLSNLPAEIDTTSDSNELKEIINDHGIRIGIIAVPPESAQSAANMLISAGITGILNFTPLRLKVPDTVRVKYVDFTIEFETLAFYLSKN